MSRSRIGEVLNASTTEFVAACDDLHRPPPFGALVSASDGERDVLGLVYHASTGSADPGRPAIVRGRGMESEEDVYHQHPQLAMLLQTEIKALVVGFDEDGVVRQHLPPRPAAIHAFLYRASDDLMQRFYQRLDFLSILIGTPVAAPVDELIAAGLRAARSSVGPAQERELTIRAGRQLVVLMNGDPARLGAVLRRLRA
ncbi:MAG: hypothetical protein U0556_14535 [Dehalococcoidia bacterium]